MVDVSDLFSMFKHHLVLFLSLSTNAKPQTVYGISLGYTIHFTTLIHVEKKKKETFWEKTGSVLSTPEMSLPLIEKSRKNRTLNGQINDK